jgi:hypothetical protein
LAAASKTLPAVVNDFSTEAERLTGDVGHGIPDLLRPKYIKNAKETKVERRLSVLWRV